MFKRSLIALIVGKVKSRRLGTEFYSMRSLGIVLKMKTHLII